MTARDRITTDPAVMQGQPVIRGTRVTVELILRKYARARRRVISWTPIPNLRQRTFARRLPLRATGEPCEVGGNRLSTARHELLAGCDDPEFDRIGAQPWVVDHVVLGHARPKLLRTYMPTLPLKEAREALQKWGEELAGILEGAATIDKPRLPLDRVVASGRY
jgi:hypothetical protein